MKKEWLLNRISRTETEIYLFFNSLNSKETLFLKYNNGEFVKDTELK